MWFAWALHWLVPSTDVVVLARTLGIGGRFPEKAACGPYL